MNPQADTLHDRITALLYDPSAQDETGTWLDRERLADLLAEAAAGQPEACTRRHLVPVDESRDEWGDAAAQPEAGRWPTMRDVLALPCSMCGVGPGEDCRGIDVDAGHLCHEARMVATRAALAAAQPVEPCDCPTYRATGACGRTEWLAEQAQPVEPEPDEREALVDDVERILRTSDRDGRALVREVIDVILAAGYRRSRPEATHTVTAEQRGRAVAEARAFVDKAQAAGLPFEETWLGACATYLRTIGVTVTDTPTQAGEDA